MQLVQNNLLQQVSLVSHRTVITEEVCQVDQCIDYHFVTNLAGYFISLADGVGDEFLEADFVERIVLGYVILLGE